MRKYRAKKDLLMDNGEKCFTKGKEYMAVKPDGPYLSPGEVEVVDDQRNRHIISGEWLKYFTKFTRR